MNRSRYVPHPAYSINPYQQQPYGAVPAHAQMGGMMPTQQSLSMPPSAYGNPQQGMGQSPIQTSLSPNTMWTANFANGPIIEDLCAPPQPMGMHPGSPPMNAFPPRMSMGPMHPGGMQHVQNVYGMPHPPTPHPFAHAMHHPGQGSQMQGIPSARVMGTYPPYTGQQHGYVYPPQQLDPNVGMMARPRLDTGFPTPVGAMPGGNGAGMGQISSPPMGGSPGNDGMPPLTPVEETLRGFLSPDLGDLGHP
ncbi:hypothetical protein C8A00DRAFT_46503 [Chaetomidium leptoderma]|uniref:Uncharacterized protein n=1 Tax=Chaetomidium leptoderma TaxID=669021 RepID=A0AAN6ZT58_9PEZI|nr:hypothetical protein C8A00DRAFT_46503 [Chaetomidium leptoderma]